MIVGHGPKGSRPTGRLPVFTTDTKEEAEALIALACPMNYNGDYVAPELAEDQSIDNLNAFGDRLADLYHRFIRKD